MNVSRWTLRPIAPKIATSPLPLSLPATGPDLHSVPASANNFLAKPEDPRPTPLLPALQLASFPPSPACYSTLSILIFCTIQTHCSLSLAPFFSLSFLVASHIITSTLFFHPFSLSRHLFVRLAFQSFPLFPPFGGRRKGSLGARRFLRLLRGADNLFNPHIHDALASCP
jgi:hypothetical protein